tara:strand:+ start:93 stop:377 length:285 start_codon:yes stop_codon:yes gene_type:complete
MGTHGGIRKGAGRPAKADELKFLEKLDKHIDQDEAIKSLKELIKDGNFNAIKLYFEYRFGKPKEVVENINMNYENGKITEEELIILNKVLESEY